MLATAGQGVARYRQQAQVSENIADLARLRSQAATLGTAAQDTVRRYGEEIGNATRTNQVDPSLVLSVILVESNGDATAQSPKGAMGLMQLMPATALHLDVQDPWRPADNIMGGTKFLAQLLKRYDNRLDLALAGYNAGPGAVDAAGKAIPPYPETERYVAKVLDMYERLKGITGTELATDPE
ncbi:MAG: lytic transglycosylase domain-containing protein [bacterium]